MNHSFFIKVIVVKLYIKMFNIVVKTVIISVNIVKKVLILYRGIQVKLKGFNISLKIILDFTPL